MKIIPIKFSLAKAIYNLYHKTNIAPIGHRKSYVALEGNQWHKLGYAELLFDDLEDLDFLENEIEIRLDDNNDQVIYTKGKVIGICSIGNTIARFKDKNIFEITRICFPSYFKPKNNKEKKYPSKFIRESIKDFKKNYKVSKLVTYIHNWQSGKYLEYAGFKKDKLIVYSNNSKGWSNRPNRNKPDLKPKIRFVA